VRGVQVWIRDPRARPAPLQSYLRRIQLPDEKALAASERASMVFPLIGSAAGASNSFWISDLTLHNPFRDPISVSLRFIAGQRSVDRNLTLAPRQTIRWPDVVRTYFGLQEIGSLWIEHREGRAPVALVQNSDIAHEGRASLEPPLTVRDAITAGSEVAEATIVGIPAHRALGSRMNVGVINLGRIPATFRISAWTRGNVRVGRSIESGVPEEEVWWTNDIERELGTAVDETMTLRVTAIAGTGAPFATVVEPDGDSHFLAAVPSGQP